MSYSDCRALLTMSYLPTAAQYVTPGSLCHGNNIAQMPTIREYGCWSNRSVHSTSPTPPNVCQTVDCALRLSPLAGRVQCTEQALKIFWIGRNLTARGGKCLQQIVEPRAHVLWRGTECVVVLAHSGRNVRTGHWFTFLKENGVWWTPDLP